MITGVHTMFYTSQPAELRAFFRDKLGFPATDAGGGWLIFALPPAELGCHPVDKTDAHGVASGTPDISFFCDNLEATVAELTARGVEFTDEIQVAGYGRTIHFKAPGDFQIQLYEPGYRT